MQLTLCLIFLIFHTIPKFKVNLKKLLSKVVNYKLYSFFSIKRVLCNMVINKLNITINLYF